MPHSATRVPCQKPRRTPCPIAFVGEAPSDEEVSNRIEIGRDKAGKRLYKADPQPFVGPSGRLFNSILRAANLDREDFLITNVFDEQAPENEVGPWLRDEALIKRNFDRLAGELQRFRPRVVVPLGSTALWAFTGRSAIGDFRGSVLPSTRIVPGVKLLPTFHPAAVMRSYKLLPLVTSDFIKAQAEAKLGPKITYPDVTLLVEPSLADVKAFCKDCLKAKLLSTDIETGWGQITSIGFAPTADLAMNIPFIDLRKPNKSYWGSLEEECQAWFAVQEVLESEVPKLGQNFTYDAAWLWVKMHIRCRNYQRDIRLLHHALYPELPKSLGSMAASYTRFGAWKHWGYGGTEDKKDN